MNWLLDTNLISETKKTQKSPEVMTWVNNQPLDHLFTSTMNIAELAYGAARLSNISKRREIENWIANKIRPWFDGRILEVDEDVLVRWRIITRQMDISGQPSPATDLLIAAVALQNRMGVATRDTKQFVATGVPTFNPWTGERFNGA
jgi:toxin FitB